MTANRRIFLNFVATYGRSLYALIIGLLCGRWMLMALGEVDYGLMGVLAGLTSFIAMFSNIFAASVARFYAFSVGESFVVGKEAEGLENCRKWFNTAVSVYTIVPAALMIVGYPIGEYAVRHWLTIPIDRMDDCVWVFRFVCLQCFVGMVNVPFQAMYTAKQYIAELTVYGVVSSTINVIILYYMLNHPGIWLKRFVFCQLLISVIPQFLIAIRALVSFPECRIRTDYMFNRGRLVALAKFAWWRLFGDIGYLIKTQGISILVNKMFGPRMNASAAIGQTVASQTGTLSASMVGALSPAVTNLAGAGERQRMMEMSYRVCRFCGLLSLVFILPLALELRTVMTLWLKNPPPFSVEVCLIMLMTLVMDEISKGIGIAITACGNLTRFFTMLGTMNVVSLPVAWFVVWTGIGGFLSVFTVLLVFRIINAFLSAIIAERVIGFSTKRWIKSVFVPLSILAALTVSIGLIPRLFLGVNTIVRLFVTTAITLAVFMPCAWKMVLTQGEREYICARFKRFK